MKILIKKFYLSFKLLVKIKYNNILIILEV